MSFTGHDYHEEFEELCHNLPQERDPVAVRGGLIILEWKLWEALRTVMLYSSMACAGVLVLPAYLFVVTPMDKSAKSATIAFGIYLVLATLFYWISRFVFHWEFSRKIEGRKFGDPLPPR